MTAQETAIERYAGFVAGSGRWSLPDGARHHAKRCVIDWFAATVPGGVLAPATLLAAALAEDLDRSRATLVPGGRKATARTAALINGAASHTVEFDDIYREGLYHPGAPVIPAALAIAEAEGASGERFLRGVIAGYEVSNRIAAAVNPAHYDFWHTTATVGFFGAAAAAAAILGLDARAAAHALATAGTMAAGLQQAFRADAMSKPLHAGRAAEGGLLAALAARAGVTGALDILEGERGFGHAMSRAVDWERATAGLGKDWTIERTTQKNHAACGHIHAALDAVMELSREHGLSPANVARIRVGSYQKAKEICGNAAPRTAFEAKFSLPYCVAAALCTGAVRIAAFSDERLADPLIREVIGRIEHTVDEECQAAFPKRRSAKVEIETTDGRRFARHALTRKGDPDNPLSDAELEDKFIELTAGVLGDTAVGLMRALWAVDGLADLGGLGLAANGAGRAAAE